MHTLQELDIREERHARGRTMRRALAMFLLLAASLIVVAAGCATTGTGQVSGVELGGSYQIRATTFHGGMR